MSQILITIKKQTSHSSSTVGVRILLMFVCLHLAGCDFTVPLAGVSETAIDIQAVGLWERTRQDGTTENLLVLPLNQHEYIIAWPKGGSRELFTRARLIEFSGKTLVQLQWLGTSDGAVADDDRIYQIAAYHIKDSDLEIRLLNPGVVGKNHSSAADLASAIEARSDHPDLFRDGLRFHRAGNGKDSALFPDQ